MVSVEGRSLVDEGSAERWALAMRFANLEIRSMVPEPGAFHPDDWEFFCECGSCRNLFRMFPEDFDRRIEGRELVLAPGHVFVAAAEARRVAERLYKESEALHAQARQVLRQAQRQREARVLVVDDSAGFRRAAAALIYAARWLHLAGSVSTGEEAVRLLSQLKPDLVLLDLHLPGIDGPETARLIRRHDPTILVVLTSIEPEGLSDIAHSGDATAFVNKAELKPSTLDALWLKHRP